MGDIRRLFEHKYPYTDLHELNLDWLIDEVIKLRDDMESEVAEIVARYLANFTLEATYNQATEELVFSLKKEA